MRIRVATPADIPVLRSIEEECFDDAMPWFVIRQFLDLAGPFALVAEEHEILGYILGARDHSSQRGWALSAAVRKQYRARGVAQKLVVELFARMQSAGMREVLLTVKPVNDPILKIAASVGAETVELDSSYFGPGEARLVIKKTF